jgi:hypothetical protein
MWVEMEVCQFWIQASAGPSQFSSGTSDTGHVLAGPLVQEEWSIDS